MAGFRAVAGILRLLGPGAVRLVDRLVADGLVERSKGRDNRAIALYLTDAGMALRQDVLKGRLAAIRPWQGEVRAMPETLLQLAPSVLV